jgi:hypothetical protein
MTSMRAAAVDSAIKIAADRLLNVGRNDVVMQFTFRDVDPMDFAYRRLDLR